MDARERHETCEPAATNPSETMTVNVRAGFVCPHCGRLMEDRRRGWVVCLTPGCPAHLKRFNYPTITLTAVVETAEYIQDAPKNTLDWLRYQQKSESLAAQ